MTMICLLFWFLDFRMINIMINIMICIGYEFRFLVNYINLRFALPSCIFTIGMPIGIVGARGPGAGGGGRAGKLIVTALLLR